MRKSLLALTPLAIALVLPLGAQKRQKKVEKLDFATRIARSQSAYADGKFAACVDELRQATVLAMQEWRKAMRAALPQPLPGWKLMPAKKDVAAQNNPMAAVMLASTAGLLNAEYRPDSGSGRIQVQVLANSPMVRMLQGMFGMAQMNDKMEAVDYENGDKALLETRGNDRYKLQILVSNKHLITVETKGLSDEQVFGFMDQGALNALKKQL